MERATSPPIGALAGAKPLIAPTRVCHITSANARPDREIGGNGAGEEITAGCAQSLQQSRHQIGRCAWFLTIRSIRHLGAEH